MLLIEWYAWWEAIAPLQAEEYLGAYTVHLVGDAGWKFDRQAILDSWRELASGARVFVDHLLQGPEPDERDLWGKMRHIAHWLKGFYGGGISDA